MQQCPLCLSQSMSFYHRDKKRSYFQCTACQLVSVPPAHHLSAVQEKLEYDKHQNSPDDIGYRKFLSRILVPLFEQMRPGSIGLDYGCGPGPTISVMAQEAGLAVSNYDPFFANYPERLTSQYDFITLTEVIEHVSRPAELLPSLNQLLKPKGILAIMTKRVKDLTAFSQWHYKNDPTHINFYSVTTFEWIAQKMNWTLKVIDKDVVFFYQSSVYSPDYQ
ncbi:class I SAM-dependent methyltransferase [Aliikangiella maris]|uniref:Class I SAM-dependent methyltransferase n=2 Tax=Aliikangiella maris TaxID=3162458 RepID=A0ABV2BSP9_9GAMM